MLSSRRRGLTGEGSHTLNWGAFVHAGHAPQKYGRKQKAQKVPDVFLPLASTCECSAKYCIGVCLCSACTSGCPKKQ